MDSLEPGTLVEFDSFATLVVGENLLLVYESGSEYVREGSLMYFHTRGPNDWVITLCDDDTWSYAEYWINRDWNGRVRTRYFDEYDDFWERLWDDCSDYEDYPLEYDQIYDDNEW